LARCDSKHKSQNQLGLVKRIKLAMPDEHVKILLFLANGFEDLEAIAIRDVFGWIQFWYGIG
jgi:hypothetical protein